MATRTVRGGVKVNNWAGAWTTWGYARHATLDTNLAGNNNDVRYVAVADDATGNSVTVRYVVAGASTPLSVTVAGSAITVNVATNAGSAATSTANDVIAAVNASAPASALVDAEVAPGNDGTGVVAAMAATNLTGYSAGGIGLGTGNWARVKQGGRGYGTV